MRRLIVLVLGTLATVPILFLCNKFYKLTRPKLLAMLVTMAVSGVLGCKLMYFVENGSFAGQSFFGAVLLAPWLVCLGAKALKVPMADALDLYAPPACIMLAVQKANCTLTGCCIGRIILYAENGDPIRFPSQILEGAAALLICIYLYWLISEGKHRGRILPVFYLTYGVSRFILNLTRDTDPYLWDLAIGNIWSIIAAVIGLLWLILLTDRKKGAS